MARADDAAGIAVIHEALDRGMTFLDTADMYGAGHNEELVGKAIKGRRDGKSCWPPNSATSAAATARSSTAGRNMSSAPARRASSASASTLSISIISTGSIRACRSRTPSAPCPGWSQQGKVRALGLSEAAPGDHHPRTGRPSDRRGAERIFAAIPGRSGRDASYDAQARYRFCRLRPARPWLLTGAVEQPAI